MKTFLTGGTGYIGTELLHKLLETNNEVVALYHKQPPGFQSSGLKWVQGSLSDVNSLVEAMQGCSRVFHMAGLARVSHPDKDAFFNINVKGTENILEAARLNQVEKLVFTSTAAVLSFSIKTPITESDPLLEPLDDDYCVTKLIAETKVLRASGNELQTVVVNPSRVYGAGVSNETSPVNNLIENFLKKSYYLIPGDGHYYANYAFIDDVVNGHLLAMEKGQTGERYIIGGENHDYLELFDQLSKLTGLKRQRICVPRWVMNSVAQVAGLWSAISGKTRKVTFSVVSKIYSNRLLSCEKAIQELDYTITPFTHGLELALSAIQKNKYHV
jgi:nucleoside-diphosphate-sugar epimerase